jgi:hypothetical protein
LQSCRVTLFSLVKHFSLSFNKPDRVGKRLKLSYMLELAVQDIVKGPSAPCESRNKTRTAVRVALKDGKLPSYRHRCPANCNANALTSRNCMFKSEGVDTDANKFILHRAYNDVLDRYVTAYTYVHTSPDIPKNFLRQGTCAGGYTEDANERFCTF